MRKRSVLKSPIFYVSAALFCCCFSVCNLVQTVNASHVHQFGWPLVAFEWSYGDEVTKVGSLTLYDTVRESRVVWLGMAINVACGLAISAVLGYLATLGFGKLTSRHLK